MKITLIPYKRIVGTCKNCGTSIHNKEQVTRSWFESFPIRSQLLYYCTGCSYLCNCGDVEWIEDRDNCIKCDNLICSNCYVSLGEDIYCNECAFYCQGCEEGAPMNEQENCDDCGMTGCVECLTEIEELYYCEDHRPNI